MFWRPVVRGVLSMAEAEPMTLTELLEVHAAMDRADRELMGIINGAMYPTKEDASGNDP